MSEYFKSPSFLTNQAVLISAVLFQIISMYFKVFIHEIIHGFLELAGGFFGGEKRRTEIYTEILYRHFTMKFTMKSLIFCISQ